MLSVGTLSYIDKEEEGGQGGGGRVRQREERRRSARESGCIQHLL